MDWLPILLAIPLAIFIYEVVRYFAVRWGRRRLLDSTKAFVRRHDIRLDRFKLTRRSFIKFELLADPVVAAAVAEEARAEEVPLAWVQAQVEEWLNEIIPSFNILSYYQLGMSLTRFVVDLVYDVIVDKEELDRVQKGLPDEAVILYLMNHRSNFDYLVVGYVLSRSIALSYAVGEWARVWPLEHLFRSFGSYFVRRGEKSPLYHKILRRYVQVVSRYGITQGVFPEGGLTRDGHFRKPKTGLLTYVAELVCDPTFDKDILLVPVAINYDTVLEDRVLVRESLGDVRPPTFAEKAKSAITFLVKAPFILGANAARVLTGRVRRHGYAAARFGEPLSLKSWLKETNIDLAALEPKERREAVRALAGAVMGRIGDVMPVPPVPLICLALKTLNEKATQNGGQPEAPSPPVSEGALRAEVSRLRGQLIAKGARLVVGEEFNEVKAQRAQLEADREDRRSGLMGMEEEMVEGEEATRTTELALEHLVRRNLVSQSPEGIVINPGDQPTIAYYAYSISHFLDEKP